jgi:hypothetical protein
MKREVVFAVTDFALVPPMGRTVSLFRMVNRLAPVAAASITAECDLQRSPYYARNLTCRFRRSRFDGKASTSSALSEGYPR